MKGELIDRYVLIRDGRDASQIYNKGYYGTPQSGGSLKLNLIEVALLLELDKIAVVRDGKAITLPELVNLATKIYPEFEIKYIVYRDLRQRGYIVKLSQVLDFEVFPRGGIPKKTASQFYVSAESERAKFSIEEIERKVGIAENEGKELLIAIVDEEGDLTYYTVSKAEPKGEIKGEEMLSGEAFLLEDRVMVWDKDLAEQLQRLEFFGKLIGKGLQLSLVEATYLMEHGVLEVKDAKSNKKVSLRQFKSRARRIQPDLSLRLKVYKDMKKKGMVVKTGFKYGTYFRVYEGDPDTCHSRYLVHAVPKGFECTWPEISRAVRLAHGVRKEMLFAKVNRKVKYIEMGRLRP